MDTPSIVGRLGLGPQAAERPRPAHQACRSQAVAQLLPVAEKHGVYLNIENIFFNGYLMTPGEMNAFVDSFNNPHVRVHFDTGNIMLFHFPEHWIPILGKRVKNVHFKEFTKKGTDHSLESFRPLLDGTTNWPAVMEALETVGYDGYLTFEYFHPYPHYPEALVAQQRGSFPSRSCLSLTSNPPQTQARASVCQSNANPRRCRVLAAENTKAPRRTIKQPVHFRVALSRQAESWQVL